ncbi:hypothetical protein MUP35_04730 [Patescibacteria group bacterium]|nr:hypothetical protein [Patescibacteria group bacterium]
MKKIIKYFAVLVVLSLIVFGFYLYKLHALALEGNKIFEQRCLKVNPHLINYKNSFLKFADAINSTKKYTDKEVESFMEEYISGMRAYVPEEDKWLETDKKYINRWDFKLIEPWYVKEASVYQLKMYEGYRDEAFWMLKLYDNKTPNEELSAKFYEAREKRNKYIDLYNEIFDKAAPLRDWRKIFGMLPVPAGCTDENTIIPNTSGSIDLEEEESTTPLPNMIPIDPRLTT